MNLKCNHEGCNGDFLLQDNGSLKCKKCKCIFRLMLVKYDTDCYNKTQMKK